MMNVPETFMQQTRKRNQQPIAPFINNVCGHSMVAHRCRHGSKQNLWMSVTAIGMIGTCVLCVQQLMATFINKVCDHSMIGNCYSLSLFGLAPGKLLWPQKHDGQWIWTHFEYLGFYVFDCVS
jgi:hypothetical protein